MTTLNFTQNSDGQYQASFVSTGSQMALQLIRTAPGTITIKANLTGLTPKVISNSSNRIEDSNFICTINLPAGLDVTVISSSSVTEGGYE